MNFIQLRKDMVENQLRARGIKDKRVLNAFLEVPRELFVPDEFKDKAYEDSPLPIGYGQTISQPYMVAIMTELLELKKSDKLLEIGSGSGYQATIASKLCGIVYSIERIPELAKFAKENLKKCNIENVEIIVGDGSLGYKEKAPYDKIIVTAATQVPPKEWFEQLKVGVGCYMVLPEGSRYLQTLVRYVKKGVDEIKKEEFFDCVFVPLKGEKGWKN